MGATAVQLVCLATLLLHNHSSANKITTSASSRGFALGSDACDMGIGSDRACMNGSIAVSDATMQVRCMEATT